MGSGQTVTKLSQEFGAGEVEGTDGKGGPNYSSQSEGDDVSKIGLFLGDEVEK